MNLFGPLFVRSAEEGQILETGLSEMLKGFMIMPEQTGN